MEGNSLEFYITIGSIIISTVGLIYIIRFNWKQYGSLFIISGIVGEILCYVFVKLNFYSYPYRLFPKITIMPFTVVLTIFPLYVLAGVRYSPKRWSVKIIFYLTIINLGVLAEGLAKNYTDLIEYKRFWDIWDSYSWWWIYLLVFEGIGTVLVNEKYRKPIKDEAFYPGRVTWFVVWFIIILTTFIGGVYVGVLL